MKYQAGQI